MSASIAEAAGDVEAIIQAAGQGSRLGLGPKAFVLLGERTLLERAVAVMLTVAASVTAAVPPADVARAVALAGGARVRIVAGGASRAETLRLLVAASAAPWLVLHDAVRPFVTTDLAGRVLDAARRSGAAAAALPNADFLYARDGSLQAAPNHAFAIQKPVAFARAAMLRGLAAADRNGARGDESALEILALASQSVAFVPGSAANLKLTTPDDLTLARRLV